MIKPPPCPRNRNRFTYLRGRYLWNQRTPQSMRNALSEFERAIELDPDYAEAYSGFADTYALVDLWVPGQDLDYRTAYELGLTAARRALSLAPDLGMAHASLGWLLRFTGEWESAEREFERAIELNPSYATAHQLYATHLGITGRESEAVIHAQRSFEFDPVSRRISANLGRALLFAGRKEEAIEQYRATTELAPAWPNGWSGHSWTLLEVGEYEEGLEAWATLSRLVDRSAEAWEEVYRAMIRYHQTGEVQPVPASVESVGPRTHRNLGQIDAAIDGHFEYFEYLVSQGAYGRAAQERTYESLDDLLGADPRYQALLEEAGITW